MQAGLKKIGEARGYGSTALYDCLISAAETMPQEPGRRKVILATSDFGDNTNTHTLESTVMRMQGTRRAVLPLSGNGPSAGKQTSQEASIGSSE